MCPPNYRFKMDRQKNCLVDYSYDSACELHPILQEFSEYLRSNRLLGLESATVQRACAFLHLKISEIGENAAAPYRDQLIAFFKERGDLRRHETLPALAEIKEKVTIPNLRKLNFGKSELQARRAITVIRKAGLTRSVSTENTYRDCLKVFCDFIKENKLGDLQHCPMDVVNRFLKMRSRTVGQKSCDKYKQAVQALLKARGSLKPKQHLPMVHSATPQKLGTRSYTESQVYLIIDSLTPPHGLATELAYRAGLRAHELFTLRRAEEKSPDTRYNKDGTVRNLENKFYKRKDDGVIYIVTGKGGLTREVIIPKELAARLEEKRLPSPVKVTDRGIFYQSYYDIPGGKRFSDAFSKASLRTLGWTTGAHGLRHSYAQERMKEMESDFYYENAKEVVSQELGHFRPDITEAYLR